MNPDSPSLFLAALCAGIVLWAALAILGWLVA